MREEDKLTIINSVWDVHYQGTTRFECDVVVGTYEEILGLLQKNKENRVVHFVFDELQEALNPMSSRFDCAFSLKESLNKHATGEGLFHMTLLWR